MSAHASPRLAAVFGLRPLHHACLEGNLERVAELTSPHHHHREDLDAPVLSVLDQSLDEEAWPSGETPIMLAALMGHLKVFEYLVRQGANYTLQDCDGFTIQFYCSELKFAVAKRAFYLNQGFGREPVRAASAARLAIVDLLDHPSRLHMMVAAVGDSGYPNLFLGKEGPKGKFFSAFLDIFQVSGVYIAILLVRIC